MVIVNLPFCLLCTGHGKKGLGPLSCYELNSTIITRLGQMESSGKLQSLLDMAW